MSEKQSNCAVCEEVFSRSNRTYSKGSCENCWNIFKRRVSSNKTIVLENCSKSCIIRETKRSTCVVCFIEKCFEVGFEYQGVNSLNDLHTYKLPQDNRCPVCKVDLQTRRSIQFGVISCRNCYEAFASTYAKFKANSLRVPECESVKRCKVRPETRSNCKHCWLKKCFKVGFRADNFVNVKCLSNDFNQNVKVIDDNECMAVATIDDEETTLESTTEKSPLTCDVCKGFRNLHKSYGSLVCGGCRTFFIICKRLEAVIPKCEFQKCKLNIKFVSCSYCRLKRCLQLGMNFERASLRGAVLKRRKYSEEEIDSIIEQCMVKSQPGIEEPKPQDFDENSSFIDSEVQHAECLSPAEENVKLIDDTECMAIEPVDDVENALDNPVAPIKSFAIPDEENRQAVPELSTKLQNSLNSSYCAVCKNSNGLKKAFGFLSCKACQSFFWSCKTKRIQLSYICSESCDVDLNYRCKSCRLKKCLEWGMNFGQCLPGQRLGNINYSPEEIESILEQCVTHEYKHQAMLTNNHDLDADDKRLSYAKDLQTKTLKSRESSKTENFVMESQLTDTFSDSLMEVDEVDKKLIVEQNSPTVSPENFVQKKSEISSCAVCDASTTHTAYGIHVCRKCYSFFYNKKKSIGRLTLCKQVCPIDWKTKSICTYCRLKKCLLLGMDFKIGPHGGRWGERSTDYTPDEVDSIIMNRIKQAESIRHKGKTSSNGNLATKRDTRVKERVNYTEDFPDVVQEKTQQELDVEFRQKRLATALVITEKEHKFMCPDCLIEFSDYRQLFRHLRLPHVNDIMRYAHLSNDYYEEMSDSESVSETLIGNTVSKSVEKSKNYECNSCGFKHANGHTDRWLYDHYAGWHGKATVACEECGAKFNKEWQRAAHLKFHHDITTLEECQKCEQTHEFYKLRRDGKFTAYHIWNSHPTLKNKSL